MADNFVEVKLVATDELSPIFAEASANVSSALSAIDTNVKGSAQAWTGMLRQIDAAETAFVRDVVARRESLSHALTNLAARLVESEIANDLRYFTNYAILSALGVNTDRAAAQQGLLSHLLMEAEKTTATTEGVAARTSAETARASAGLVAQTAGAIKSIAIDAGQTFAGIFAFLSPLMGPAAAGPAAAGAAAVYAAAGSIAAFDVGAWSIPQDMMGVLHAGETVVPESFASGFRSAVGGGGSDAGAAAMAPNIPSRRRSPRSTPSRSSRCSTILRSCGSSRATCNPISPPIRACAGAIDGMVNALATVDGSALGFVDGLGGLILPMPSIPTFPTLKGVTWPVSRAPLQSTIKQEAISGKQTRLQLYSYGRYKYGLTFSYLGSGAQNQDWQLLMSFFQSVAGAALLFHFNDIYDNQVAGQVLGYGDGANRNFFFQRTLSLVTEPILDVTQATATVRVATVAQDPSTYNFVTDPNWGCTYGIQFKAGNAPAAGAPVTADFSYNWPCRFDDDTAEFSSFMFNFWELKKLTFTTEKVI